MSISVHVYCVTLESFLCPVVVWMVSTDTWWFNTVTPHCPLQDEQIEWGKQELTTTDFQQKVKEYNAQINSNLFMNMVRGVETHHINEFHSKWVFSLV